MAEILKARDTGRPGEPIVAVKRILPHLTDDRQFATMFLDESRVLAQLEHENVIHTLEVGTVDETPYITLEYVFGQDARMLFHRARRNELNIPIPIACYVISQVCAGLHYAHEQRDAAGNLLGLVHRDVSLQNILISYDGAVKLTDFGIAMSAQNVARTEAGIVKGKFGYMSPEQIRGEPMDRRSDVFATGICLYELLTNERLFSGDSDYAAVEKVRNVDIVEPSRINRLIPSELEDIVLRALARRARDRFQSAHDLRRALLSFMVERHNECSGSDLSAYMRDVFAEEIRKLPTPQSTMRDSAQGTEEGTGLAAFDNLDPVSALSALNPEPLREDGAFGAPTRQLGHDGAGHDGAGYAEGGHVEGGYAEGGHAEGGYAEGGYAEGGYDAPTDGISVDAAPPDYGGLGRAAAPSVPPVIPRPGSIPPYHQAADDAAAEGDWEDEAQTLHGRPLEGVEALPETVDEDVTRQVHVGSTFTGVASPAGPRLSQPSLVGAPSPFTAPEEEPTAVVQGDAVPGLTDVVLPSTQPAPTARDSYTMIVVIVVGMVALIAGALYLARGEEPGAIHLTTIPRDAVVKIDGKLLAASASPFVINDLEPGDEHVIAVEKEGFKGWSAHLRVRSGQTLKLPLVTLEPDGVGDEMLDSPRQEAAAESVRPKARPARVARPAKTSTKSSAKTSKATSTTRRTSTASRQRKPKKPLAVPQGGTGTLRLNSRPWSQVTVDGKMIGNTPQTNLRLSAGAHTIKLFNPDFGLRKTVKVQIKANQTVTKIVDLQ